MNFDLMFDCEIANHHIKAWYKNFNPWWADLDENPPLPALHCVRKISGVISKQQ